VCSSDLAQAIGCEVIYCDVDPDSLVATDLTIAALLSNEIKAIVVTHLYGNIAPIDRIRSLCVPFGIAVIEDCAQAHGALYTGRPVGSIGAFGAWSFYPTKNLGAIGDAGALTSNDQEIINATRQLRNYGESSRFHHERAGLNSRLDELQAAILLQRLIYLQSWTDRRRAIANRYWAEINNPHINALAQPSDPLEHVHHLFVLRSDRRDKLRNHLDQKGIQTLIHYPVPCHQQKALEQHRVGPSGLLFAEQHSASLLSLPIHPFLKDQEVDIVIAGCNGFH
jgi:dTDP-4-amino-4,6-dideoxygalactose transaminase